MIIDNVLEAAAPYLKERTVKDLVIGLALTAVELDDGNIGVSYTLTEHLPPGCSAFSFAQDVIGKNATEVAGLAKRGTDDAQRGVGIAVLTAASRGQNLVDVATLKSSFGVEILPTDTVGMIGFIPSIAAKFPKESKNLIIFDIAVSEFGEEIENVYPMEDQAKLLPECDVVILTGTTMINHTIDNLLKICSNARDIVMVGSSTPMFPEAFKDTNIKTLAGSWWSNDNKEELFKIISTAGGIIHLREFMIKKAVAVK